MTNGSRRLLVRITLVALLVLLVVAYWAFDLGHYFDLAYLKEAQQRLSAVVQARPLTASVVFFLIYVLVTAASLPGAAVMTLAAGAVFGVLWALVLVSFASSVGATCAMLVARTVLGDAVQRRFGDQLGAVNRGFERDGGFYLFSLRMVPLFPFFVVNLVMGLTPIRTWTFYWVSQAGMLPGTFVYVFAGRQLATIEHVGDVLSPGLIIALSLLGLFPLLARKGIGWIRRARSGVGEQS